MSNEEWKEWLNCYFNLPQNKTLIQQKEKENQFQLLSPAREYWFRPLFDVDITTISVVLVGARPYYDFYASDGICFSSLGDTDKLTNLLYKKIYSDIGIQVNLEDNTKDRWIKQGILPIPMQWTVLSGKEGDQDTFWFDFTKNILIHLIQDNQPRFFCFFDSFSQKYKNIFNINNIYNYPILYCDLSNSNHWQLNVFYKINKYIKDKYNYEINWK